MTSHRAFLRLAFLLCFAFAATAQGARVLFLGDSMSMGSFGTTLDQRLRDAGHEVHTYATGGATPYYWLKEFDTISSDIGHWVKTPDSEKRVRVVKAVPKVEDLMKKINPDVVVIQTGTNLYASLRSKRQTPAERVQTVEYMVDRMCRAVTATGRKVYWITPPDAHEKKFSRELQTQMRELMKRVAGKHGRVFDSWSVTKFTEPYPAEDGIHYGPEDAAAWAGKVADDFQAWAAKLSWKREKPDQKAADAGSESIRKATPVEGKNHNKLTVTLRLTAKSNFEAPAEVTYRNALAVYEYEVVRVDKGQYSLPKIRIAHMVMLDRKILNPRDWKIGRTLSLDLVPLATYPSIEKIQTLDELPEDPSLPLFCPKL